MKEVLLLKCGEIILKGLNRKDASNIYGFFHNDANEDLENHPANDSENNS